IGANYFGLGSYEGGLCVLSSKVHAPGEKVAHPHVELPEVRQTFRVLGWQAPGSWGLKFGTNENHLSAGFCRWRARFGPGPSGLEGPDLVRLVLERGNSARQALEVLCELIERYGQTSARDDHIFLLADPREAFVVEAAGPHWAILECQQTLAV